ncbi:ALF repeat-containing protein, partial [Streptomyces sp. NPDC047880]|uniref:ALF repeat-containing protein n=1 Tax=Streptomyces sp. NPDC047880 TaxID=3155626 RepID=UPI0034536892
MRLTRGALLVAAGALAPALLLTTPAFAAGTAPAAVAVVSAAPSDGTPVDEMSEDELRIAIARILADPDSGRGVAREANEALDGTVEDMREFLKTGYRLAQAEDDRVAIVRIIGDPDSGRGVKREATKALDTNTPEALRAFLETGYRLAQAEDDRVAIVRIIGDPDSGRGVKREATKALDTNTPEALRAFL